MLKKTKLMIFGTDNMLRNSQLPELTLNDKVTNFVIFVNYLGVNRITKLIMDTS